MQGLLLVVIDVDHQAVKFYTVDRSQYEVVRGLNNKRYSKLEDKGPLDKILTHDSEGLKPNAGLTEIPRPTACAEHIVLWMDETTLQRPQ
jgi:hypothetical protein